MKNSERNKIEKLCLSCLGAKDIFDGEDYIKCTYCNGTGHATKEENECFMDLEINNKN